MNLVVIQPLLPQYSISFFNRLIELNPDLNLTVLADIETQSPLNNFSSEVCKFQTHHVSRRHFYGLEYRPRLMKALRNARGDLVIFNGNPRDISQILAMLILRAKSQKFCVWGMFHRIGGPRLVSCFYYRLVGVIANKCLTYSRTGAVNLVSIGVPKYKIGIVGTAIDEKIPQKYRDRITIDQLNLFREKNNIKDNQVVLQVVRLSRIKRPELLVHAAELLVEGRKDLVFVLIGDGEMREEVEQLITQKNLSAHFRILGAIYDESILSFWYAAASVFVVPTCIGLSAHHAMSYGIPVVTDDSLDSQASEFEIVSDGLNGLTYREGSVSDMAKSLTKILDDGELRIRLSKNALITVNTLHNIDEKVRNFSLLVRNIF